MKGTNVHKQFILSSIFFEEAEKGRLQNPLHNLIEPRCLPSNQNNYDSRWENVVVENDQRNGKVNSWIKITKRAAELSQRWVFLPNPPPPLPSSFSSSAQSEQMLHQEFSLWSVPSSDTSEGPLATCTNMMIPDGERRGSGHLRMRRDLESLSSSFGQSGEIGKTFLAMHVE